MNSTHAPVCRCSLHTQIAARRHESYKLLAQTILGPDAPSETAELTRALAEHAKLLAPADSLTHLTARRAA
jgi:hypothetical protein